MHAPPRVRAGLGDGDLVITAGLMDPIGVFGFRAYDTFIGAEQLVAVWGLRDGRLRALVYGDELGARRTGAIGAVAVDLAAGPGPVRLGLLGAGTQAWAQLWAITAVREMAAVTVAARHQERAAAFAERAAAKLGLTVRPVAQAEDAVRDKDVVIVATNSAVPVLRGRLDRPRRAPDHAGPEDPITARIPRRPGRTGGGDPHRLTRPAGGLPGAAPVRWPAGNPPRGRTRRGRGGQVQPGADNDLLLHRLGRHRSRRRRGTVPPSMKRGTRTWAIRSMHVGGQMPWGCRVPGSALTPPAQVRLRGEAGFGVAVAEGAGHRLPVPRIAGPVPA